MTNFATLHNQRARGEVKLHMDAAGIKILRESGAAKVRLPPGLREAYLINTAGGIAGGDRFSSEFQLAENTNLVITSQAAERVYRTLEPVAKIENRITLASNSKLSWMPHETILFDGAALDRRIHVNMASNARFMGLETTVFGREASGEKIASILYRENWRIIRGGKLIHSDVLAIDGDLPNSKATLADARAIATLILIDPNSETFVERLQKTIGKNGGASAWNGKLVARFLAKDGMILKKAIVSALSMLASPAELPKTWAL